jgi:hypothetical protein
MADYLLTVADAFVLPPQPSYAPFRTSAVYEARADHRQIRIALADQRSDRAPVLCAGNNVKTSGSMGEGILAHRGQFFIDEPFRKSKKIKEFVERRQHREY